MEMAAEDSLDTSDPQSSPSHLEEGVGFPSQMGSGRRDARVVCETFTSGRDFLDGAAPRARLSESQKSLKQMKHRVSTYTHSRNPLFACFIGESVLSSRAVRLNCDSGTSQRALFSLIPMDTSRVNEKTGEPSSPQLSCIGQVKCRQAKAARAAVAEDLARMDLNEEPLPRSSHPTSKEVRGSGTRNAERERPFRRTADQIPHLDLNEGNEDSDEKHNPRLMRFSKRAGTGEGERSHVEKGDPEYDKHLNQSASKNSIQHIHHLIRQLLGSSMIKSGLICGWSSRNSTDGDEPDAADHYEIDLSRFASCDLQPKTPSFRDSRYYQTAMGKKLAAIRVHTQQADHEETHVDFVEETDGKDDVGRRSPKAGDTPTIIIKCSVERPDVLRRPDSEASLWKRRCMDRPLSLEVKR